MKKKLLGTLFTLCLFACAFAVFASAATTISDAEGLLTLMNTTDATALADDYVLSADINLSDYSGELTQSPIGENGNPFTGTFDGGNHTISGINLTGERQTALFANVKGSASDAAVVKNLTIEGTVAGTGIFCGGVIGATINNVIVEDVINNATVSGGQYSGGVIGCIYFDESETGATVRGCINNGTFTSSNGYVGGIVGIVGSNFADVPAAATASVDCNSNDVTISGCYNFGNVTANAGNVAGGVLGYYMYRGKTGMANLTIEKSANYAAVKATSGGYVGGVIGVILEGNNLRYVTVELSELFNAGTIAASNTTYMGSIASLVRIPKVTSGVAPVSAHDCLNTSVASYGMFGAFGATTCSWSASNLCNTAGTYIIANKTATSGNVVQNSNTVTLTNCVNSASSATDIAALTATDAFVDVLGTPALKEFAEISSVDDLLFLAAHPEMWEENYILTADLDLADVAFTPIGNATVKFRGIFDGNGKTISNLSITATAAGAGLFGTTVGATVKNLTLENVNISGLGDNGGLVGLSYGGTYENCHVTSGTVTSTNTSGYSGMLIGRLETYSTTPHCVVKDCTANGTITGKKYIGGVIGTTILRVVADNTITLTGLRNYATVKGTDNVAGGIVGYLLARSTTVDNAGTYIVDDCINYGTVGAKQWAGGIFGSIGDSSNYYYSGSFTNLANFGTIASTTKTQDGAIAGDIRISKIDSSLTLTLKNWYNRGTVSGGRGLLGTVSSNTAEGAAFTLENAYNATDDTIIATYTDTSAALTVNDVDVTLTNCYTNKSTHKFFDASAPTMGAGWEELGGETVLSSSVIEISTADELVSLMNNPDLWGGNFRVTKNIDLDGKVCTPMGTSGDNSVKFTGIFDGDNHAITNFTTTQTGQYVGLFGLAWDAVIADVDLSGSFTAKQSRCGGLVGAVRANAVIRNCTTDVDVTSSGYGALGGILGMYTYYEDGCLLIENCVNNGDITGTQYLGGIVGYVYKASDTSAVEITIKNCVNNGNITAICADSALACAAGIAGYAVITSDSTFTIDGCKNYGDIAAEHASHYLAGIMAATAAASSVTVDNLHVTVTNCENHGDVTGTGTVYAGIFAFYNNLAANTEGAAIDTLTIDKCANYGDITASNYGAGIYGQTSNSNGAVDADIILTNLYNSGVIDCGTFSGEIAACIRSLQSGAYTLSDWCGRGPLALPLTAAFGTSKVNFTFTRVYNVNGGTVVKTLNGNTFDTVDSLTETATATEIAALAANDGWTAIGNTAVPSFTVKTIGTANELAALMADENAWNYNYKLTANVDLDGKTQSRIGEVTSTVNNPFTGIFDGNGYKIEGIDISDTSHHTGFFGAARNAVVTNLTVTGKVTSTVGLAGGLFGSATAPLVIDNVINNIDVESKGTYVGGLAGVVYYAYPDTDVVISNCKNNASVTGSGYVGGMVGAAGSYFTSIATLPKAAVENNNLTITKCVNDGAVTATSGNVAGGIMGYLMYRGSAGDNTFTANKCANYGAVSANGTSSDYVGGVFGALLEKVTDTHPVITLNLSELHNSGAVSATKMSYSGSVIGLVRASYALEDGTYPVYISDIYNDSTTTNVGLVGAAEGAYQVTEAAWTITRAYNYTGEYVFNKKTATTGTVEYSTSTTDTTVTLTDCYNNASTDAANLLASDLWKDTAAQGPMLVEYAIADTLDNSIDSAIELMLLMNSPTRWHESFTVSRDIDLSTYKGDLAQQPIGNNLYAFTGSFDGQGYTISGVDLSGDMYGMGFFGIVSSDGDATVIKDFTLKGSIASAKQFVGGAVGLVCGSVEISDIINEATVTSTYYGSNAGRIGGIVGVITLNNFLGEIRRVQSIDGTVNVTIRNCVNNADITGTAHDEYAAYGQTRVGGIVGSVSPTHSNRGVSNILIEGCVNNADITAHAIVGGIAGKIEGGGHPENTVYVTKCSNYGNITTNYKGGYIGWNGAYAGGIVGYAGLRFDDVAEGEAVPEPCKEMVISFCYNAGDVTAPYANLIGTTPYEILPDDFVSDDTTADEGTGEDGVTSDTTVTEVPSYFKRNAQIGGILGYACEGTDSVVITVKNSLNDGHIYAPGNDIGGIIGIANPAHVLDNHNRGKVESTLTYLDGTTTRPGKYVGGIIGRLNHPEHDVFARNVNSGETVSTGGAGFFGIGGGYNRYASSYTDNYYISALTTDKNSTHVSEDIHLSSSFAGLNANEAWVFTTKYGPELVYFHECDEVNHEDYMWVKQEDGTYSYYACCDKTVKASDVEVPYIYVDNNTHLSSFVGSDENDGLTAATAVATIEKAVEKLAKTGGRVILADRYRITTDVTLPAYEKTVTFTTENFETGFVTANHGVTINLNGPTAFENIIFNGSRTTERDGAYHNTLVIAANWNDLTIGPRISTYGNAYIIAGSNGVNVAEKDLGNKTVNITLYRTLAHAILDADKNTLAAAMPFYDMVILGDRVRGSEAYTVKNVKINFTSEDATFNNFYLGTTSNEAADAQMVNYDVNAVFNGVADAYINSMRTGTSNVESGTAYIDHVNLELNGTAYVKNSFIARNVKDFDVVISDGADRVESSTGAKKLNRTRFYFSAGSSFTGPATIDITYGTHSFANNVEYPMYNEAYTVNDTVNEECTWETSVTTEHTVDAMGVKTTKCTECGRFTTEEFHVETLEGLKLAYNATSGKYELNCPVCGVALASTDEAVVYVGKLDNGVYSGDNAKDGLTKETAVATLNEAVTKLSDVGGKVVFLARYDVKNSNIVLPEYTKQITLSGVSDASGNAVSGFYNETGIAHIYLGGPTKFDNIVFKGSKEIRIIGNWNNLDFGYVRVHDESNIYIIAGKYNLKEDDTEPKDITINLDGATMSTSSTSESGTSETIFYDRIYLGSVYAANNLTVSNKKVTLNVEKGKHNEALIDVLYTMSTTSNQNYAASTTEGCESVVNLYDGTEIARGRVGDYNVGYSYSGGSFDKLTLNFYDNSTITGDYHIKNTTETVVNIFGDNRTVKIAKQFITMRYGTFTDDETAVLTVNGDNHSVGVTPIARHSTNSEAGEKYDITLNIKNVCVWDEGVITTAPTDTTAGVKTYTCTICGDTYTEVVCGTYTHEYIKQADGTYKCRICGAVSEELVMPVGGVLITADAGKIENGKLTVNVTVDADAVAATYFNVDAPEGFTLESVTDNSADALALHANESLALPYKVILMNMNAANVALDNATVVTLVFTVDETVFTTSGEIVITNIETINADEKDLYTATVNATVAHEHNYSVEFVADTATKEAHKVYTCICGDTYEEVAVATKYAGTINYGSTVHLESDLGLEIIVSTAEKLIYDENGANPSAERVWIIIEVTDENGVVTKTVAHPYAVGLNDNGNMVYRFNGPRIAAKEIADNVNITFCANVANEKVTGTAQAINIIAYYKAAEAAGAYNGASEAVMNVLDAMMNYGAAAQEYFGYNESNLATTLTDVEKIDYTKVEVEANGTTTLGSEDLAIKATGVSAILDEKIILKLVFADVTDATLVFKGTYTDIKGNVKTFESPVSITESGAVVKVDQIAAKDLRQVFTGALYSGDTQVSKSVTTSFEAFATQTINTTDVPLLKAVCRAALVYSDMAKAYFSAK